MLNQLRRGASGWTAKVLLGLLVVSFGVWGIADVFNGGTSTTVLTAGKTVVSAQDYQLAYRQALNRIGQQLQRLPTSEEAEMFGVDQYVLAQLTQNAVLDEQGRRIGLGLSDDGLRRIIQEDPTFHDANGNFSRNAFRDVLQNARISESAYLTNLGETALRSQIVDAVVEDMGAPKLFSTALGLYNGERRTISYIAVAPAAPETIAEPSADALGTYFKDHAAAYRTAEYRAFTYVDLTPTGLADPSKITDEQIAKQYEGDRSRYTTPEKRRIQQVVFPDKAAADSAAAKLKSGSTFEAIAQEAGRTPAETELGLVGRTEIADKTIADAAFALAANVPSEVVTGAFGPTILRITEIQPESVRPLDEVREDIRKELSLTAANDATTKAYESFEDARASGSTIQEAATKAGLPLRTVTAVDAQGLGPDEKPVAELPSGKSLVDAVFETEIGSDNPPLSYGSGSFVFYDVTSVDPARDRTLEEVRSRVVADWKKAEAARLLGERMTALKKRVDDGQTLADVASAEKLEVRTAPSITRASGPAEIGPTAAAAFSGPSGVVATAAGKNEGEQILLQVTQVSSPADPLSNVPPEQGGQLSGALQNDLLQSYASLLQRETPVRYNPAAVDAAKSSYR